MSAQPEPAQGLSARLDQPLIAVIIEEHGQDIIRYFVDEKEADAFVKERRRVGSVESLAGAWSYMDEDEVLDSLDRIRHESRPTPPLEDI
jgi:hypothetical protein